VDVDLPNVVKRWADVWAPLRAKYGKLILAEMGDSTS
jgi:hypothetical protein